MQKDERSDDEEEEEELVVEEKQRMELNGKLKGPDVAMNGEVVGSGKGVLGPMISSEDSDRKATLRKR